MEDLKKYTEGVKGIIFDYGGTLDTGGRHWSWVIWEAWQQAGVACDLPTFREAYVWGERELAQILRRKMITKAEKNLKKYTRKKKHKLKRDE